MAMTNINAVFLRWDRTRSVRKGDQLEKLCRQKLQPYIDKAIGHYGRYTRKDAARLTVHPLTLKRVFFIDSLGYFVSAVIRLIMRASHPSIHQIQFWDKVIVPISGLTDKVFGRFFGRVMIWQKT
jgi:hypothetical protein